ncbi:MAG: M16 family metallopeptidase, partial [Spirochaetales bacterium]
MEKSQGEANSVALKTVILFVLVCATANAAPDIQITPETSADEARNELPQDPAVRTGTLENGLTYYVRENARPENRASLRLAINAGSILEDEDQLGLAHFLEHMAFAGTESFEEDEIIGFLEDIGMRFGPHVNAYVSFDETVYSLEVPTEDAEVMERALRILEEWGHRIALDDQDVERERGVIIEEWRQGLGASQRLREQQFPVLLQDSRYAERLPIGDTDLIRNFDPQVLRRFYEDWYRPDLMAVVAVGDFDGSQVEQWIREHFGKMEAHEDPRERPTYTVPGHDERLFAPAADPEQPDTQVSIYNKAEIPPVQTEEHYRERIANRLFSRMINQRFTELVQQTDTALLSGSSGRSRFVRPASVYYLSGSVEEDMVDEGLTALVREATRVQEFGFTESEFERAKRNEMRDMERTYRQRDQLGHEEFASEYLDAFLRDEAFPGIEYEYELYEEMIPDIRIEEVNALADNYLAPHNQVVLVSMVEEEDTELPDEATLADAMESVDRDELEAYEDIETDDELRVTIDEPGSIEQETYHEDIETWEWELSNGATVVVKPTDFRDDEILFHAFSYGGASRFPEEDSINAEFATTLVDEAGIEDYSSNALSRILSGKEVTLQPYIDMYSEGFTGSTSPEDIESFLRLLALHHGEPREDESIFDSTRRRIEGRLQNAEAQPNFQFSTTLQRLLWDDHPRSRPVTADRVEELDYQRALDIYRDRFADAGDFTYFLVGDIDVDTLRPLVSRYIGGLPGLGRNDRSEDTGMRFADDTIRETVRSGEAPQSITALVFSGLHDYGQRENIELRMLAEVLRIRLRESLRQEEGAVYSVSAQAQPRRFPVEQYILQVVFGSDPEEAERISERALEEMRSIRDGNLEETYAGRAREAQLRAYEEGMQENSFWRDNLVSLYRNERELSDLVTFPDVVEEIEREDLIEAAGQYLNEDRYIELILLPEEES